MVTGKAGLPQSVQAGGLLSILDMFFRKKRFFQRVYNANGNLTKPGQTNSCTFLAPCKLLKIKRHNPTWNPIRSTTTFKKLERLSFQTWCRNHQPCHGLTPGPYPNWHGKSQQQYITPLTHQHACLHKIGCPNMQTVSMLGVTPGFGQKHILK